MTPRRSAATTLLSTAALYGVFRAVGWLDVPALQTPFTEAWLKVGVWVVPSVGVLCLVWRQSIANALAELGLMSNPIAGYGFALLASLPMLVAPNAGFLPAVRASAIAGTVVLTPITEEILFRGLLFRQLHRRAGRNLVWAMVISALAFACAHLSPGDFHTRSLGWLLGTQIGMTTVIGVILAWLVWRWDSLWPAIGMHTCLNLSWELYGSGLSGGIKPFPMRVASMTIAVLLTLRLTRSRRDADRLR